MGKIPGVKGLEIVNLLPYPHKLHRDIQFFLHREDNASLCRAVQLGENNPADTGGVFKLPGLADGVLSCGGVDVYKRQLLYMIEHKNVK